MPTGLGRVVLTGSLQSDEGTPPKVMRRLGSYALVHVQAGGGWYADETGRGFDVGTGDAIVLFPDVGHAYGPPPGGRWIEQFVKFEGPVFDLWRASGVLDERRPVRRVPTGHSWHARVRRLVDGVGEDGPLGPLTDVCELQGVLAELLSLTPESETALLGPDDLAWLERARAVLSADTRRDIPLPRIASELAMSYDGFRKRFRDLAGMSPAQYRSHRSIERACELLLDHRLTVRDVALELGYCDEFHFSHRFKQMTGHSPKGFRENRRQAPPDAR